MNMLARIPDQLMVGKQKYTAQQLQLIWQTSAKDCNETEFSQFMHVAGHLGLDPMRKQIYAFVFSKDDAAKRQMSIITGVGGYSTIADRTGCYLPPEEPPKFTIDPALIDEATNPQGLVDCTITIKKFSHNEWHKITHRVEWLAYAPIIESGDNDDYEWIDTGETWKDTGKPKKKKQLKEGRTKRAILDPGKKRWRIDPKGMLGKCCLVGAIRLAFPDNFSGVYDETEMDKSTSIDLTAAEYAETAAVEHRLELIAGKDSILFDFMDDEGLHPVKIGSLADRCAEFIAKHGESLEALETWQDRNRHPLKDFWARNKTDALAVKALLEAALTKAKAKQEAEAKAKAQASIQATNDELSP
jgi:phage recombination protein Bet